MKHLMFIIMLLIISISCYAQESPKNYTLLLLPFEDRTGIENPLLAAFNDTIDFVLSRQTGPVQVRLIPKSDRDAFLARAAAMYSDKTLLDQGLLAAEWADADGLITGSYTKKGTQWSLQAQVYHLREGRKARQEIQIQGDSLYKLLDDFPAHLLKQFQASYIALTTNSWKAYEEFRKGHEELQNYNFFGALEYYDKALKLDPTLALAYAEQSYAYFIMGQGEQTTEAINRAQQYVSQTSPVEQMAIQAFKFCWDAKARSFRYEGAVDFLTSGGGYDEEWLRWVMANGYQESGRLKEAAKEYERWFTLAEEKLRWKRDDLSYLYTLAAKCAGAHIHMDKAIEYAERLLQLNPPPVELIDLLVYLYGQQGQIEKAFQLAPTEVKGWAEEDRIKTIMSLGVQGCSDALSQIILEHDVPLKQVRHWLQPLMTSNNPTSRGRGHYLLAWAYARGGDLENAKSLYAQIGAPWEQDWWVVGPFDGDEHDLNDVLPPEKDIHLNQTYEGAVEPVRWKRAEDGYLNGTVEFTKSLNWPEEQVISGRLGGRIYPKVFPGRGFQQSYSNHRWIAYALIYIELDNARNANLDLGVGGDAEGKLWLNDTEQSVNKPIQLRAGLNKILVKALQRENHGFSFTLRVTDSEGNPIPGLRFRPANEVLGEQ
jgi:tetratricopeptide (TPR) repeat protein